MRIICLLLKSKELLEISHVVLLRKKAYVCAFTFHAHSVMFDTVTDCDNRVFFCSCKHCSRALLLSFFVVLSFWYVEERERGALASNHAKIMPQ